jgi:predicted DCC family thiol-disulfide oxidoreductase YuxK
VAVAAPTERPIVVFDDGCPVCRRSVRLLRGMDWLRRLDTLGYSAAVERFPEVSRGTLGDGLRVRFPDGSVRVGIDAVRSIAMRTPLGAPLAWPLYVPGLRAVGDRAYRAYAVRRTRDADACPIPASRTARERERVSR